MASLPLTRVTPSKEKQESIRRAVRDSESLAELGRLVTRSDVEILTELLADSRVSGQIYTLPSQINSDTVAIFIEQHLIERERGEGLLMMSTDQRGLAYAYYDIQFWPQWAACELGGAIRPDQQNSGKGGSGALESFRWLFEDIGVELICETAALENVRTASLLERIGFEYMSKIESELPEGGVRPSHYWELTKEKWQRTRSAQR